MKFSPKSQEELAHANLMSEGVYPFEIIEAEDKKSKSGNDMIQLKLKVWDKNGHERVIYDYLLEALHFKLRHFAESTGLLQKYEGGEFTSSDCLGKSGNAHIIIQKGRENAEGGFYPDKNSVKDYKMEIKNNDYAKKDEKPFVDDVLPF